MKGLQSATSAGISYRLRARCHRREDPGQMLGAAPDGPAKTALAKALGFYVYASNARTARVARSNYEALALNPLFERCEPLKRSVESLQSGSRGMRSLPAATTLGVAISFRGVEPLFACANERVIAAESDTKFREARGRSISEAQWTYGGLPGPGPQARSMVYPPEPMQ